MNANWIRTLWNRSALVAIPLIPAHCWGVVVWNEGSQSDLSGDRLAPSSLSFAVGSNELIATTGGGDLDYITFAVPVGQQLSGLTLAAYSGPDGRAFLGLQAGSTFTESPALPVTQNMLGYTHFGPAEGNVGIDLLPQIANKPQTQGFTPPLQANSYAIWLQQLGAPATYRLDFLVTVVPEPSSGMLYAAGLLLGAWAIGRRFRA